MAIELATPQDRVILPVEEFTNWQKMSFHLLVPGLFAIARLNPGNYEILRGQRLNIDLQVRPDGTGELDFVQVSKSGSLGATTKFLSSDDPSFVYADPIAGDPNNGLIKKVVYFRNDHVDSSPLGNDSGIKTPVRSST